MSDQDPPGRHDVVEQKSFFEDNPARLATCFFGNPNFPRNMRNKLTFAASRLAGCKNVLEIGAGRGLQLSYFVELMPEDCRYTGIDLAHSALLIAKNRLQSGVTQRIALANSCAEDLPFRNGAFDGMFCLDALHHVTSQVEVLREARRVLQPGSPIVCIEPNPRYPVNLVYRRDPIEKKLFDLTPSNAAEWGRKAGLVDVTIDHLPVFFPSFPLRLERAYERLEHLLGEIQSLKAFSTTRVF